ncbi:MAG: oligopeptide transporter, OPT family [Candidatus Neomarinimicrobiota bacterium]|nr:oligopeptide transporter, OPT family [Candidatus Neomarinimicrobiota bacterium]MEC7872588.1 oligopeptide transporter, OPT family [Candidatus Neomarinimicrobiota bacterium]MEC9006506.1 oligopeptide transporter, OPT family [Candidatus Neomarinimicrobiota bacterium]MEC9437334.1 oligopeptide transporter, OPT family [Candidatus Neomarinimicrobiota bacterium]MED5433389.1 oligopeptide transporter, OPT family [Candidatus Neomarinimicrobiota bacterium]|tara:strand:+ start:1683 stop:3551 length:1869 start_codon:yes stop_codon:yes gene_type:complete
MSNNQNSEITIKAVFLGIILSMILAGANAYLGLFAGMTVSASIPAAVISMGVLSLFKNSNIRENNIVQTAASAGESLAAGVIFTIPALVLLGYWDSFDYAEVAKIAAIGGVIGVLFTVPLRRALIINAKLTYPEGVATAAVLRAGDEAKQEKSTENSGGLGTIALTSLAGGLMKLFQQGFGMWHVEAASARAIGGSIFGIGTDLSPALISVGYIVGRNIGILVVAGGLISWAFAIPIYSAMVGFQGDPLDAAFNIWTTKIRYLGVGAMVVGGVWSLIKLFKPLIEGIRASLDALKNNASNENIPTEEKDMPINYVGIALLALLVPVFLLYVGIVDSLPVAALLTVVMMVFGFLFSAVAAYMAGVVGSSNNPISGVTIATILFTSILLLALLGTGSGTGAASAIMVGAVVCCAAAIGGDNLQDLKAGQLVGATPWKQQVMQIVGTLSSAIVLGLVLDILHTAYTIGSPTLSAPQATLMKSVADGVFTGNLPWMFVYIGGLIAVALILIDLRQEKVGSDFRVPVLAVAVGIYLPITLTVPIFIGGMVSHLGKTAGGTENSEKKGLLMSSGFITGEALMGILVAVPIFLSGNKDWWPKLGEFNWLGPVLFAGMIVWLYKAVSKNK